MAIRDNQPAKPNPAAKMVKIASVKPASRVVPVDAEEKRRRSRPLSGKSALNIHLDDDVLAFYRASGPGWQGRLNDDLRKINGLDD